MWNPFKTKSVKTMPVDLNSQYVYVHIPGLRKWLDTYALEQLANRPFDECRVLLTEDTLNELLELLPDVDNPCEYAAFVVQYYLVNILGYSYAHVDYAHPGDNKMLYLVLKP